MALAKGLAGGFPIGAFLTKEKATAMGPGDHGSTFGGNPLACAAGLATLRYLVDHDVPANALKIGAYIMERLSTMETKRPIISEVRGRGCLIALEFTEDIAGKLVEACIRHGLLVNPVLPNAIRLMPPLNITTAEADEAIAKIHAGLQDIL
jgi:acetylornithine/succinyldiaminopimelate/putrescine aminotransferase